MQIFLFFKFKFKFKSTGEGKPVACGPGAISHSSALLCNRNNIKQCIQTFGMLYQKQGEKRLTSHQSPVTRLVLPLPKTKRNLLFPILRGSIQLFYHVSWP